MQICIHACIQTYLLNVLVSVLSVRQTDIVLVDQQERAIEHAKYTSIGVLRAIGLNHVEVVMLYIYEATTIVVTSALLGTVIGILVACSLTLQFNLFTEMPFVMRFPTSLYCVVLVLALICATVGSYFPVRNFMKRSIADIIRRQ
jgi:ABC-type lipoprotein release transport system permease subunit